jgi:peptidyl-prolyl cis-trans isomerase SurA
MSESLLRTPQPPRGRRTFVAACLTCLGVAAAVPLASLPRAAAAQEAGAARAGDFIVAVVNQELVTNSEVQQRVVRVEQDASRSRAKVPPRQELRKQVLDQLIDERAQLSLAREYGMRVDETELDRAVASVAAQNQLTLPQLRERLQRDGVEYSRFRSNVRDQLLLERLRDRELVSRARVSDTEIEDWLNRQRQESGSATEYNIAQVLIPVPEGVTPERVTQLRARADAALARARAGEDFGALVRELSAASKDNGGQIGMRPASRLPDLFVEAVRTLKPGEVAPQVVRSGAGFHVLRLAEKRDAGSAVTQHRARHILLRPGEKLSQQAAIDRLAEYKRQIEVGRARFEQLARDHSQDGSAAQGGDLGWAAPGQFVPEFEQELVRLEPGGISAPVVSRFGVHLIQLIERRQAPVDARQQRETARNALREQKMDQAYAEWSREVRARAYVELREPPL